MGIVLEIELCGERHMQRFRNSEMDMSRSRQSGIFFQPRQVRWDRVSSRHDRFKLIVPLLIGQHHATQVEVHVFGKVARFICVIQAGFVRLPTSISVLANGCGSQSCRPCRISSVVRRVRSAQPFGLEWRAKAIERPNYVTSVSRQDLAAAARHRAQRLRQVTKQFHGGPYVVARIGRGSIRNHCS